MNQQDLPKNGGSTTLMDLPLVVIEKIFHYISYEEMSHIRGTCKYIQKHVERMLNEGFYQLGRQVTRSSVSLKRQLPKKESERRMHPLNRYSEIFSALETRYTLLTMTYRKYIDQRLCCFIPGRVLDEAFRVMRQINGFLATGTPVSTSFDVIGILRDIRDYSSMAMEHFDEHVAPRLPARPVIPVLKPSAHSLPTFPQFYYRVPNAFNRLDGECGTSSKRSCESSDELYSSLRNEMKGKFEEQNRVIEEQRKLIGEQSGFIRHIVNFLGEMGKQSEWTPGLMDNLHRLSSQYENLACGSDDSTHDQTYSHMKDSASLPTSPVKRRKIIQITESVSNKSDEIYERKESETTFVAVEDLRIEKAKKRTKPTTENKHNGKRPKSSEVAQRLTNHQCRYNLRNRNAK